MKEDIFEQFRDYDVKVNLYGFNYNVTDVKINDENKEIIMYAKSPNVNMACPTQFDIGDPVIVDLSEDQKIKGHIRTIIFTSSKVRYSVLVENKHRQDKESYTTLHNIDSVFVKPDQEGEKWKMPLDNYS